MLTVNQRLILNCMKTNQRQKSKLHTLLHEQLKNELTHIGAQFEEKCWLWNKRHVFGSFLECCDFVF